MVSRKIKFLIPRDRGELLPIFLTLFLISVYVIFELSVILPTIYHNIFTYKEILHLLFGFYAIFNVMGNLYLSMITDTSVDTIICPVMLPAATVQATTADNKSQDLIYYHCNWHYCHQCEVNVPPRSKHCFLCKRCILKHEHHCSFIGRCIGFRNVRYYVCFLVWTWVRKLPSTWSSKTSCLMLLDRSVLLQYSTYGLHIWTCWSIFMACYHW